MLTTPNPVLNPIHKHRLLTYYEVFLGKLVKQYATFVVP